MKNVPLACSRAFNVQPDRDNSGFDQSCVAIRADLLMTLAATKAFYTINGKARMNKSAKKYGQVLGENEKDEGISK